MREILTLTTDTLLRRAVVYRRIAVVTLASMLLGPATSVIAGAWWPLAGLLAPIPASGLFLWLDRRLVRAWVAAVVDISERTNVPLTAVTSALRHMKQLPRATLEGMLAELAAAEPLRRAPPAKVANG